MIAGLSMLYGSSEEGSISMGLFLACRQWLQLPELRQSMCKVRSVLDIGPRRSQKFRCFLQHESSYSEQDGEATVEAVTQSQHLSDV